MTPKELAAMQQALEALELCGADDMAYIKSEKAIIALREALEQPDEIDWIETNKALANEIIELQKQAEQEPVAWMEDSIEFYASDRPSNTFTIPLYAAPVRTKDLTDVDLWNLWEKSDSNIAFARSVIAADREKNK